MLNKPSNLHREGGPSGEDFIDTEVLEEVDLHEPDPSWTIDHAIGILNQLNSVQSSGATCMLRPRGDTDLLSHLVNVDEVRQVLTWDITADRLRAEKALAVSAVDVSAAIDKIDLLFQVPVIGLRTANSALHLTSGFPQRVQKIQRRDSYRVRMRAYGRGGPQVQASLAKGASPVRMRMLDLSLGGCGLLLPAGHDGLEAGTLLDPVQVELDDELSFATGLKVQWSKPVREKDTMVRRIRVGCSWVRLPPAAERKLQMFLDRVQRQRRMKLMDKH